MSVAAHTPHSPSISNHRGDYPYAMSYPTPDDQRPFTGYYPRETGGSSHGQAPPTPLASGTGLSGQGQGQGTAPPSSGTSPVERLHSSHGFGKGVPVPPESPVYHEMGAPPGSSHGYPQPQGHNINQSPVTPLSASNAYPPQPPSTGYYGLTTPDDHELEHEQEHEQQIPSPPPTALDRSLPGAQFTADGIPIVPVGVSGGKMFRCRGYGECDKVFTRSEHLARHVRWVTSHPQHTSDPH